MTESAKVSWLSEMASLLREYQQSAKDDRAAMRALYRQMGDEMNISDKAVEAAAMALYAAEGYPKLNERSWDTYREKARAALEAAAPHMKRDHAE